VPVTAPLAHIIQGAPLPIAIGWVGACLIAAGGAGIFLGRGTAMEVAGWIGLGIGFAAAATVIAITAILPTSAAISIRLAAPASGAVTSPLEVAVCGRTRAGAPAPAPDGDNVLAVVVDGKETTIERTGSFAVAIPQGRHRLRVELLTRDHRVFTPRVAVETTITVTGEGPLIAEPGCR